MGMNAPPLTPTLLSPCTLGSLSEFIALLVFHRKQPGQQKMTGRRDGRTACYHHCAQQELKPVEPWENQEGPHPQPTGLLTHPFFSQHVPKKLAVEAGAEDTPNRVNCAGLAKERRGREPLEAPQAGRGRKEVGWGRDHKASDRERKRGIRSEGPCGAQSRQGEKISLGLSLAQTNETMSP